MFFFFIELNLSYLVCPFNFLHRIHNKISRFTYKILYLLPSNLATNSSVRWVVAQSVFYHLYNQVSYMSLDQITPLTFSIGNTMKRISVIVSSIIIFHTPVQPVNALGAAIAILGTFLYSQVYYVLPLFFSAERERERDTNG